MENSPIKYAIVSGVGPDKPGIVAALCNVFHRHKFNIEDSTMTRLGPEFAVILIISVHDSVTLDALRLDLDSLETQFDLRLDVRDISEDMLKSRDWSQATPYMFSVAGHDQTGLTHQVANCLAHHDVNITDLNAQVIDGEGGKVYIMMIEADVPPAASLAKLEEELQALGKQLSVEVKMRPIEAVSL